MTTTRKPTTTEQLSLAFELYHRIPRGRKVTAQQLQLELASIGIERDIRTIQRNLDVVVHYLDVDKDTRSKPYGYSRRLNSHLVLGPRESIILKLSKALASVTLPPSMHLAIETAFEPIANHQQTYPGIKSTQGEQQKVHVELSNTVTITGLEKQFEPIALALTYQRMMTIILINRSVLKHIKPLGLIFAEAQFYLVYQTPNDEIHDIALNVVNKVKVSTFHFDYPIDFELTQYRLTSRDYPTTQTHSKKSESA